MCNVIIIDSAFENVATMKKTPSSKGEREGGREREEDKGEKEMGGRIVIIYRAIFSRILLFVTRQQTSSCCKMISFSVNHLLNLVYPTSHWFINQLKREKAIVYQIDHHNITPFLPSFRKMFRLLICIRSL